MRMEDFKETIAKEMEARIKGVKITPTKNWKNNGIVRNGLTICKEQEDVAPVLYIDSFFECYKKGELSVEDIIEQVVCDYQNLSTPDIPDLDILLSADAIMNKLNLRLLNWEMNKERIEECHLLYHLVEGTDLVCLFYVDIYDEGECSGAICLTEKIKEKYKDFSEESLSKFNTSLADYVWLPIIFEDGIPKLRWYDEWKIEDFGKKNI